MKRALLLLLCAHCGGEPFSLGDQTASIGDPPLTSVDAGNDDAAPDVDAGTVTHDAGKPSRDATPTIDAPIAVVDANEAGAVVDAGAPDVDVPDVAVADAGPDRLCCVHSTGAPAVCGDTAWYCCMTSPCTSTAACGASLGDDGGPACLPGAMCGALGTMPTGTVAFCH